MIRFMDYSGVNVSQTRSSNAHLAKLLQSRETFAVVASNSLLMFWIYRVSYILDLCLIKTSILLCTYGQIS